MAEIFLRLVNMSITASWLIVAVIILRLLLKKAPKWVHCLLWCMVGVRLLLPISIESVFSLIPSAETLPQEILYEAFPVIDSGINSVNQTLNPMLQESLAPNPGDSVNPLQIVVFLASYIWIMGMLILLLYTVITYGRLKRRVREAVRYEENIYQSEKVATPFVMGVMRPRIYLPYGLKDEELQCVVAHEQAHIRRRDHLWKPLAFLILTVYWFNPLVWVAYILLCRDIEYACDEKVLTTMGFHMKKTYSTALLHCSVHGSALRRMIAACPVAFGEVGVKSRIKSVLHYKKPTFVVIVIAIIVCVVCALCFLTNPKKDDASTETAELSQEELGTKVNQDPLQSPPSMILQEALSSTWNSFEVKSGTYSWHYPNPDSNDEMVSVEACGPAALDAVKEEEWLKLPDSGRLDYVGYIASFDVEPDRIVVRELQYSGNAEMMMLSTVSGTVYEERHGLELRKNRIYEVTAEWDEEHLGTNGFFGQAYYTFATGEISIE